TGAPAPGAPQDMGLSATPGTRCMLMLAVAAGESGANPELSRNGVLVRVRGFPRARARASVRGPADSAPGRPARVLRRPGLAEWAGGRTTPCASRAAPCPRRGPVPSEGEPHVTIAPADPVSASDVPPEGDGPGAALLRTLTVLTADLPDADPGRVAAAALRGRSARADEAELRELATEAAAGLISEDPAYSRLAARLLTLAIREEAASQGVTSFTSSVATGHREGLVADRTAAFVRRHGDRLDALVDTAADDRFGYFGLRTLHSRYLLRHPITRKAVETPQHFLLRVASGLAEDDSTRSVDEVAALYGLMSRLDYLPSSPTLFNSGTRH